MFKLWVVQSLLSLLVLQDQAIAQTLRNVTVDDADPSITYVGVWEPDSMHPSALDFGGSHTLSEDPSGSATFTFTGVAVYYLSPKWPYLVNSYVSLDGGDGPAQSSPNGEETVQWAPLWGATGLSNGIHKVVVTIGTSRYAVVDGFIYTTQSADSTTTPHVVVTIVSTTTIPPNQGTSNGTTSQASFTSLATTAGSITNSTSMIATTVSPPSVACLILLTILIIFCMCRERNPDNNAGLGTEMQTHGLRYFGTGYSASTTGSASGAGLSAQRQMSHANAPLHDHDAYGQSPVSNRALAVPGAGGAYNTRSLRTTTDRYNTSAPGAGGRYHSGSYGAVAAHAGVGLSSAAAVVPPNQPPAPLSENTHLDGPYTPYSGGSNAGYSAYPAYPSTSAVALAAPVRPSDDW